MDATQVRALLQAVTACYLEKQVELACYDAVIGDGDHGYSLARGCNAANAAMETLPADASAYDLLQTYGRELTNEVGGAMGPLFGMLFTELGKAAGASGQLGTQEFYRGLQQALEKIMALGGAQPGDKTMVDAMVPTVQALEEAAAAQLPLPQALHKAREAAAQGVADTIPMQARCGRSQYLREKSIGHQDAGATSFYYLIDTCCRVAGKEHQ